MTSIDMIKQHYKCPKCANGSCIEGGLAATGKGLSKMFDIQTNKFTTITCTNCGYTEFYKDNIMGELSGSDILDMFFGG